jgi:hypothetical protein
MSARGQNDGQERGRDLGPAAGSRRLALEVAILASGSGTPGSPAALPTEALGGARLVLVGARDPELRGYLRDCLRERGDLRVVDLGVERSMSDAGAPAALVIVDALTAVPGRHASTPRLMLADEAPDVRGAAPVAILPTPFNRRGLLGAVAALLGPPT